MAQDVVLAMFKQCKAHIRQAKVLPSSGGALDPAVGLQNCIWIIFISGRGLQQGFLNIFVTGCLSM